MGDQPGDATPTSTIPIVKEPQDVQPEPQTPSYSGTPSDPGTSSDPGTPSSSEGPPTPSEIPPTPSEKLLPSSEYASTASSVHGSTTPASTAPTETSCSCHHRCECDCDCDQGTGTDEELCGYCARYCR